LLPCYISELICQEGGLSARTLVHKTVWQNTAPRAPHY